MTPLETELRARGLERYWTAARPWLRNAIVLSPRPAEALPPGASRLGGQPDLPPTLDWPRGPSGPLHFIAQINFADCRPQDRDGLLPAGGWLYLFYDCEREGWGFDPADRDGFRVLYHDGDPSMLAPRPVPEDLDAFPALGLDFSSRPEIPSRDSWMLRHLDWSEAESEAYWDWATSRGEERRHKLLGHSDPIQSEMELECQLVSHGEYCGDPEVYASERARALAPGAIDWRLLLQIDSDEEHSGMLWGDGGRLYLWLRRQDLAARAFERSWLVLQCY